MSPSEDVKFSNVRGLYLRKYGILWIWIILLMYHNFLGLRGLQGTHMNTLKPKNSKLIQFTVRGDFFTFWDILAHSVPCHGTPSTPRDDTPDSIAVTLIFIIDHCTFWIWWYHPVVSVATILTYIAEMHIFSTFLYLINIPQRISIECAKISSVQYRLESLLGAFTVI